jgi:hypothetical protein
MRQGLQRFLDQPVLVRFAALGFVGLIFMAVWMARTGNEPGVGVSDLELKFRALLEQALVARPRTKEFVVGHPAFLLAGFLAVKGHPAWAVPLILLGMVGQTSMLNTFCHIHTPLALSVLRTFNGLWLGVLIGAGLCGLASRLVRAPDGCCPHES